MNNMELFINTLPIMLQGMLGIFIVLIVIYLLIVLLNRTTARHGGGADGSADADAASNDAK